MNQNGAIKGLSTYWRQNYVQLVCTTVIQWEGIDSSFKKHITIERKFKSKVAKFLHERQAERWLKARVKVIKHHNGSPLCWRLPKKCLKSALTARWDLSNLQMLLAINSTVGSEVENA